MKVLIGCEQSGRVANAFAKKGHDAWSNDIQEATHNGNHLTMDVCEAIKNRGPWDFIGLHPPCTALAVSGNRWYGKQKKHHQKRIDAIKWTVELWQIAVDHAPMVYLENPVGVLPLTFQQYIQPWQFGHGETKKTGLALHNLPLLVPTKIVAGREQRVWKMPPSENRAQMRSLTYQGVAEAMAQQWG